ncbi:MAG TPA: hypothetical protein VI432_00650 [Candidatus Paceibacterota bacterium]
MQKGYIALTSTIVISILILTIILAVSFTGFSTRSNLLNYYYKEITRSVAEGCINTALSKSAQDPLYEGNETIDIGQDTCMIYPIENDIPNIQKVIKAKAVLKRVATNLKVTVNLLTLDIIAWEEIENL